MYFFIYSFDVYLLNMYCVVRQLLSLGSGGGHAHLSPHTSASGVKVSEAVLTAWEGMDLSIYSLGSQNPCFMEMCVFWMHSEKHWWFIIVAFGIWV